MHRLLLVLLSCTLCAISASANAYSAQIQALEASINEARQMGLDPAMISQMETLLATAKAEAEREGQVGEGPRMQPNAFDVLSGNEGGRSYADCDEYSDSQAFGFCQYAAHTWLMYTELFAKEGDSDAAQQVYAGHEDSVRNLIQYVDHFMTAPRNR
ncbi:MAG: hypothetical protein JJU22_09120 [Gammaproteobacteria bacterium]|nr:hypothetical protein [Gammaproteobacteria bacterium]